MRMDVKDAKMYRVSWGLMGMGQIIVATCTCGTPVQYSSAMHADSAAAVVDRI